MSLFKYFFKVERNADFMDFINSILVILASFSGLAIGYALAVISQEEMKKGRKYFLIMEKVFRLLVFVPALYITFLNYGWLYFILFLIGGFISFFVENITLLLFYFLSFFMISLAAKEPSFHLVQASLIFLYGFPAGSLLRIRSFSLKN